MNYVGASLVVTPLCVLLSMQLTQPLGNNPPGALSVSLPSKPDSKKVRGLSQAKSFLRKIRCSHERPSLDWDCFQWLAFLGI